MEPAKHSTPSKNPLTCTLRPSLNFLGRDNISDPGMFVILQCRDLHQRMFCIRLMHGFGVVPEVLHGKSFRIARSPRPLRPRIPIGVQRDAFNFEQLAPLFEFRGPIARPNGAQIREQRSLAWQVFEKVERFLPRCTKTGVPVFLRKNPTVLLRPIHVSPLRLAMSPWLAPRVPAELVEHLALRD